MPAIATISFVSLHFPNLTLFHRSKYDTIELKFYRKSPLTGKRSIYFMNKFVYVCMLKKTHTFSSFDVICF